ncbi:unnamed protein product [Cylicocyclus nassatus]|uniref:Peptidase M13 N-terminal domain-containing protein n=1 Tax=Cylicocyclus nassatus TaxID=53992 RepID=A0AA36HCH5_CYLNA|nr:unnamed protein product [Cylicocyclus nassatus]
MQCLLPIFCWWCAGPTKSPEDDIGTSPGYKLASKMIRDHQLLGGSMSGPIEFTCGNWVKNNPIPCHHMTFSQYIKLGDKVEKELREDGNLSTNRKKTEKDVDKVIELKTDIAKIRGGASNEYNLRRFGNLRKHMPLIDWDRFFLEVAPPAAHSYFKSDPLILVRQSDYLKRLNELLKYKDPRIITNYVFLRFSSILPKEMGGRYEDVTQDYMRAMYGRQEKAPRWKECTKSTKDLSKYATSAMYIRKAFDKKALYKAEKMLRLVAYPDFILDDKKLDEQYEGLNIDDNDSYAKLMEKVARFGIKYIFKRLTEPVDRSEYDFNPAAVNVTTLR